MVHILQALNTYGFPDDVACRWPKCGRTCKTRYGKKYGPRGERDKGIRVECLFNVNVCYDIWDNSSMKPASLRVRITKTLRCDSRQK